MRIFIISPKLNYGGAEHVGCMLANGLADNGHEVTLIGCAYRGNGTYHINENVRVLYLNSSKNKYKKWINYIISLRRYVKTYSPDVIIGIMWSCSLIGKISSTGKNIPVINTEHDSFERPQSAPMSKAHHFLKFQVNKIYNCITVITEADKKVIGNKLKHVHVMPNPLDLTPAENVPYKKEVILAAGRLEDWHCKGFDVLIKAWASIADKHPDWSLAIAGIGTTNEIAFINNLAAQNNVSNRIKLLGFRTDMIDLYRDSAIFVLSSRYEGFGLVLIEAMSQGCACVATDYKGRQSEIILNGNEGLTCPPDDADALADGMETFMSNGEYRGIVQRNAILASRRFTLDKFIYRWESLLNDISQ